MSKRKNVKKKRGAPRRYLTITEYAAHRDITPSSVSRALGSGKIRKIGSGHNKGKIDKIAADEMWESNSLSTNINGEKEAAQSQVHKERTILVGAKAKKETIVAERELIKLRILKGELINRNEVLNGVETISRQNRDLWLNWPKLVATRMAEELNVDSGLLYDTLAKEVRAYLEKMATMDMSRVTDTN